MNLFTWRGSNEGGDEAGGGSQKGREHNGSKPSNVETVLGAGDPVSESLPGCSLKGQR
jgi:hypothetical protein